MQSGELIVTGSNSIIIVLRQFPAEVRARFKHEHFERVPCNPGDADTLCYDVNLVENDFILIITWNVSSVREIVWHVSY